METTDMGKAMGAAMMGLLGVVMLGFMASWLSQAQAAPPTQGTLAVDTTPVKGPVYLNGALQGTAPITVNLDPGPYTVSFGDVEGYVTPQSITVSIVAGETTTVTGIYEVSPGGYTCPYCGAWFATLEEVNDHIASQHPGEPLLIEIIWD
jgi:hypothetical protein